ncbi:hypothetical protein BDA99DRAFT_531443 [Phascolomyces articulosus]|uniref:Uncharacterized protein n=1 Tax=Phascolomyces articulosus TaxID=60185 RepID=A0AAD5PL16_9FUNG|nr:hypothetical protein BDA99DRAFT_531443 [Phascolomyces articulosus]
MTLRIPPVALVVSGALTGVVALVAISYVADRYHSTTSPQSPTTTASNTNATSSETRRSTRLRRSRHVRRRRLRSGHHRRTEASGDPEDPVSLLQVPLSESEEEVALWSDDDNKNLLNVIYAISETQARKEGYIHRGITCNKCGVSPIRGTRYKCANCVDFDLCEMCEGSNSHLTTHVFLKIRIPIPPLANPRSALLPAFYPGNDENSRWALTSEEIRELQEKSHFDHLELEALHEQFKSLATVDKNEHHERGIDNETFEQCLGPLGLEKNLITERIFAFFDQDRDSVISFSELVGGLSVLCKGNLDEKIEYAFKGYDLDEDGYISRDELYRMFKSYFYLSMELVRDVVSAMEDEMMDNFEFSASQPVSAAFNVAIPSLPSSSQNSSDEEDEEDHDEQHGDDENILNQQHDERRRERRGRRRYPNKENYFQQQYREQQEENEDDEDIEALGHEEEEPEYLKDEPSFEFDRSLDKNKQRHNTMTTTRNIVEQEEIEDDEDVVGPSSPKRTWEEKFPIMETMSQDAINEMVDKTFKNIDAKREGYISLEEFRQCVQTDSSIVSWFEALGTVF